MRGVNNEIIEEIIIGAAKRLINNNPGGPVPGSTRDYNNYYHQRLINNNPGGPVPGSTRDYNNYYHQRLINNIIRD